MFRNRVQGMGMQSLHKPSSEHLEFDELCRGIDEFEPLPELIARRLPAEPDQKPEASGTLDPLILAGLVSPV
jgi:hypothetical protein